MQDLHHSLKIFEKVTNKAFYTPTFDYIEVPCKEQYQNIEEFYSTLFHEMIHSTGHKNRLDRLETGASAHFGSETYSKEELVAELECELIVATEEPYTDPSIFKSSSPQNPTVIALPILFSIQKFI